jgi:prepilin-type processing-associated H-X9-DG protein
MQFSLSTLFLIFFNVAASLAAFGAWGLWIAAVFLIVAIILNRSVSLGAGVILALELIFVGLICPGIFFLPAVGVPREAGWRAQCKNNLEKINLALHKYHDANGHFPMTNKVGKNGDLLLSWRVEILPMMDQGYFFNYRYNLLKKDEPWDSPRNAEVLKQLFSEVYKCPSASRGKINNFNTNYVAVIGPGTAWHEDGPVKLSDLPDGGKHTVMVVEVVNSGVHWAEPRDLTVGEALDRMKSREGLHISTTHAGYIQILFADGHAQSISTYTSISVWEKLLGGEIKDIDNIENIVDDSSPAMDNYLPEYELEISSEVEQSAWPVIFSLIVWLLSVVLLFRRAIKSRPKLSINQLSLQPEEAIPQSPLPPGDTKLHSPLPPGEG